MPENVVAEGEAETSVLLGEPPSNEDCEERVLKKLYARLIPVGLLIVLFCYMDRGNLGFAANTFCKDLKLSTAAYGFGAGLFYVGYATFQIPSNVILARLGAPVWLGVIMIFWGFVASGLAVANSAHQFYLLRLALGFAEAGTFPGLWYHFTVFFPEHRMTLPLATLELALILSLPISSPIAVGLLSMDGWLGLAGWRWLFLVEGVFPIFLGVYVFIFWPKNIQSAKFLTPSEKHWLLQHVKSTQANEPPSNKPSHVLQDVVFQLGGVVKSWGFWLITLVAFIRAVGMHVVLYFTTLIIHAFLDDEPAEEGTESKTCSASSSLGLGPVALSAVPFAIAAIACYVVGWVSQKSGERARLAGMTTMVCSGFFATFPTLSRIGLIWGFAAYCVGVITCYAPFALVLSLGISYMPPSSKAMGLALFNTLAMLGGFVGPWITGNMVDKSTASEGIHKYSGVALLVGCMMAFGGLITYFIQDPLKQKEKSNPKKIDDQEGPSDSTQGSAL